MLSRNERIERKAQLLEQLDSERKIKLEGSFTNHVADAVRARSLSERQQALDRAKEAHENALDAVLYEILDERASPLRKRA